MPPSCELLFAATLTLSGVPRAVATQASGLDAIPAPQDSSRVARLLNEVEETSADDLRSAARRHLRQRRKSSEFVDSPEKPIPLYEDMLANPDAYQDEPVILWGRAQGVGPDPAPTSAEAGTRRIEAWFHDDSSQPMRVVVPWSDRGENPPLPSKDEPFVGVGLFRKLDHGMPVFVARQLEPLRTRLLPELVAKLEHETEQRHEERDAYFTAIVQAKMADTSIRSTAAEFRRARAAKFGVKDVADFPTFVDLFKHRDDYHGRPVTLRGHTWSITKVPAFDPENGDEAEYGIDTLYQIQLYTPHSQTNAATIVCTELPPGLPTSGHLEERVDGIEVTGFFYKMGKYYDQQNVGRKIPIIVAKTVGWNPPTNERFVVPGWVYAAVGGGVLLLVGLVWWASRGDARARRSLRERLADGATSDSDFLDGPPSLND